MLSYPILSDPEKKLAGALGIVGANGFARRVTYVVDREGIIRYISPQVNVATHGADLVKVLDELKIPRKAAP